MSEKYLTAAVVLALVLVFGIGIASEYGGICPTTQTNDPTATTVSAVEEGTNP